MFANNVNVSPQYGINVRVSAERGASVGECWVSGIELAYE